jgi:hypothetical protein
MSIAKMLSHLSGLSPQARYALMKLWLENGDSFPLQLSVQDCALDLAMPRARAGKVINELIDKGHVEPDYSFGQRGRPKRLINIPAATTEMLGNLTPTQSSDVLHLKSIHRLLAHRTSDAGAASPSLSPANIVFLIALLSCANEGGAVHGLGTAELSTYTGMTAQRINLQVRKMRKLGLILYSSTGTTGARIMGRTAASYWLDRSHPLLKPPDRSTIIENSAVSIELGNTANALFDIANQIRILKREDKKKPNKVLGDQEAMTLALTNLNVGWIELIPDFEISLAEDFFKDANPELRLAFQLLLDKFARATAIARIRGSLNEIQMSPTFSMLRPLYRELLPVRFQSHSSTDFPTKENRRMLLRLVLKTANIMATDIIAQLPENGAKLFSTASFELIPMMKTPTDRLLLTEIASYPPQSTDG